MLELVDVEFCCGIIIIVIMYEGEKKKNITCKKTFFRLFVRKHIIYSLDRWGGQQGGE